VIIDMILVLTKDNFLVIRILKKIGGNLDLYLVKGAKFCFLNPS